MANRYWVASFAGTWNDTFNWSTTSGGIGGASVPGASDDVIFDGNGFGNCTLNINASVASLNAQSGYTGAIDFGTSNFTVSGNFTLDHGGGMDFGSGTHYMGGFFDVKDCGTLDYATSSVELAGTGTNMLTWSDTDTNKSFYDVIVSGNLTTQNVPYSAVRATNSYTLSGTLTHNATSGARMTKADACPMVVSGTLTGVGTCAVSTTASGAGSLTISGSGSVTISKLAMSLGGVTGSYVELGAGDYSSCDVEMSTSNSGSDAPLRLSGSVTLKSLNFTTSSGANMVVQNSTHNPSITLKGDLTCTTSNVVWSAGTGTITLDNTAAQTVNFNGQTVEAIIVSDNASNEITLSSNFTTPYVHDCADLIDENGYTVTTTGSDPSPCSTGNRFWVGLADSDYENSGNWSASSGGSGGASVPVGSNNVVFDSNSSVNCTMSASRSMESLNLYSYAGTFSAGSHSVRVKNSVIASGSTTIFDLGSSNWTVGETWNLRFISGSSTEGTSTVRLTSQTGSARWLWKPSGGNFSNVIVAQNAIIDQRRRLDVQGSFTLESGATWIVGTSELNIFSDASLTLGDSSSITTSTGTVELSADGTGVRTGNATASIGNFKTANYNTGSLTTIPVATYTGTFRFGQNAASYNGTWRFEGNTVIEGDVSVGMGKTTNETIDLATNNASLTLKGDVDITPSQGTVTWSAGDGTIIFDNSGSQSVNFNGQTVEGIHVTDASTGSIVLASDFSTAWLRDCDSLIDLNGYTITNADSVDRCAYPYDPPTTIALDSSAAINTDLEGWWHFLEGTGSAAADISNSANNLSHSFGEFVWSVTKIGTAGNLTGTGLLSTSTAPTLADKLTISQWLYYEGDISRETSFAGHSGGSNYAWAFRTENSGDPMRFFVNGSYTQSSQLPLDQWVHIVGVYDGTDIRLYIDGVQDGTPTSVTGNVNSFTSIYIGNQNASSSVFPFTGLVQNSRIWSRALSSSEVSSLYSAPWIGSDYTAVVPPSNRFFSPAAFARLG